MNVTMKSLLTLALIAVSAPALAAGAVEHPKQEQWAFDGVTGKFDKPAVQRGLQVYKEVCAACHGLKRVAFRTLEGAGFSEAEVKSLAAGYDIQDGPNDDGEMFARPGRPSDKFPSPYANDQAGRAMNNGALPPDLSLIVKARGDGANYLYSLLTGYGDAPAYTCKKVNAEGECIGFKKLSKKDAEAAAEAAAEAQASAAKAAPKADAAVEEDAVAESAEGKLFYCSDIVHSEAVDAETGETTTVDSCTEMGEGMHYNPYFAGKQIKMPHPLMPDQVTYQDETKATVEQMAHDVTSFLQWAAEPEMEARKRMGIKVILFLAVMTGFFIVAKKRIWSKLDH